MFINESPDRLSLKSGNTHVIIKNPIDIIPAIIWFSVILDANIPNDIYDMQNSKNPNIVANAVVICGIP